MGFITALPLTVATVVMAAATLSSSSSAFNAFVAPSSQIQLRQHTSCARSVVGKSRHDRDVSPCMKYVPDGLSPEQWKKMQKEEAVKKKKMGDLGQVSSAQFFFSSPCITLRRIMYLYDAECIIYFVQHTYEYTISSTAGIMLYTWYTGAASSSTTNCYLLYLYFEGLAMTTAAAVRTQSRAMYLSPWECLIEIMNVRGFKCRVSWNPN